MMSRALRPCVFRRSAEQRESPPLLSIALCRRRRRRLRARAAVRHSLTGACSHNKQVEEDGLAQLSAVAPLLRRRGGPGLVHLILAVPAQVLETGGVAGAGGEAVFRLLVEEVGAHAGRRGGGVSLLHRSHFS